MSKEVLAVDIDEVLFPFVAEFVSFHNSRYGSHLAATDFFSYDFEHVIGVSFEETIDRVYEFCGTDHASIEPLPAARRALAKLSEQFQLAVVTARHPQFEQATKLWLENNFPNIILASQFIGYAAVMEKPRTKVEVCRQLGAVALVDDSLKHVSDCPGQGIDAVLFGDYPWNQSVTDLPAGVTRCKDWLAVLEYFNG